MGWLPYPGNGSSGGINASDIPNQKPIPFSYIGIQDGVAALDDDGTVPLRQLPAGLPGIIPPPAPSVLGGLFSKAAVAHTFVTGIGTDGTPSVAIPVAADISDFSTSVLGLAVPLVGGTMTGDLSVGNNSSNPIRINLNGAAAATKNIRWQTAGVTRWSWGPDAAAEAGSASATMSASVAAGINTLPVATTAGVNSGMQVVVANVPTITYVVNAVGTTIFTKTARANVLSGDTVIPLTDATATPVGTIVTGTNIAANSLVSIVGGATGVVTKTMTTNNSSGQSQIGVPNITSISIGMMVSGTGISDNTYVTDTITGSTTFAVVLSNNTNAFIPVGTVISFTPAIVISTPTNGPITSGDTLTFNPTIIISQNTTGSGIANGTTITFLPNSGANLNLNATNDQGNSWIVPMIANRATGNVKFNIGGISILPPVAMAPTSFTTMPSLFLSQSSWSGRARPANGTFAKLHWINITSDNVDYGNQGAIALRVDYGYGGAAGMTGGRVAADFELNQVAGFATIGGVGSGNNSQRIALQSVVTAGESAGGTAPTIGSAAGALFALATYSRLFAAGVRSYVTGAVNYKELCGWNLNLGAQSGTSVAVKHAINISLLSDDAVQGSVEDSAIQIAMQNGAGGFKNLYTIGNVEGCYPLLLTSKILNTYRSNATLPMRADVGFELRDIAFGTAVIAAPGLILAQATTSVGALVTSTSGNVTSLDTTLLHVTGAVVAAHLTGIWVVGMSAFDGPPGTNCNQFLVASVDGSGHLLTVTGPIGPAYISAAPSNPVLITDQSGNCTANLTLTYSSSPSLAIQPSGGKLGIFGATPVAQQTVTDLPSVIAAMKAYGLSTP